MQMVKCDQSGLQFMLVAVSIGHWRDEACSGYDRLGGREGRGRGSRILPVEGARLTSALCGPSQCVQWGHEQTHPSCLLFLCETK